MTAIVGSSLQIGTNGIYGSVPGEARAACYFAPVVTSDTGVNPTYHYAFGERFIPTLIADADRAWLVGQEIEPVYDMAAGCIGLEAASHYVSAYLKPNTHLDTLNLSMIDMVSRDSGASITNLVGLLIQPMVGATNNLAIKTVGLPDAPAKHEFGGSIDVKGYFNGGISLSITDQTSGQGAYFSNGCALNFDNVTNGQGCGIINNRGYAQGITQPRDFIIRDGMSNDIALFKATNLSFKVYGGFGCNGNTPQTKQTSGGTLSGVITALVNMGILSS